MRPPTPSSVADRTLALTSVLARALLEVDEELDAHDALDEWKKLQDLADATYLHASEREAIRARVGSWSRNVALNATWSVEGLAVLHWAMLSATALPSPDTKVDVGRIPVSPLASPERFRQDATLRAADEIAQAEDAYSFLWWRMQWIGEGKSVLPSNVRDTVAAVQADPSTHLGTGLAFEHEEGDLRMFGRPVFRLAREQQHLLHSIALERTRALRWLVGQEPDWYEVRLDT